MQRDTNLVQVKAGGPTPVLIIGTSLLLFLNFLLGLVLAPRRNYESAAELAGYVSAPVLWPAVIATLFLFVPRFRNARSWSRVVFWISLFWLLGQLGAFYRVLTTVA